MIKIESIEQNGPVENTYEVLEAINILNKAKQNNRMIFIDGSPFMGDIITNESIKSCNIITIMNELVGG